MMKRIKRITFLIIAAFALLYGTGFTRMIPDSIMESRKIIAVQDSLKQEYTHLLNTSELLVQRIKLLRSKESLNAREHRNLQKLLKDAQQLTLDKNAILEQIDLLSIQLDSTLFNGLASIHQKLESITREPQSQSLDSSDVELIDQYLLWKAELESYEKLYKPSGSHSLSLKIQDQDSKSDLQLKGDVLLDREDQFREEMALIDQRVHSLKIEADVRRKVRDMSSELEIFNEDEELLTRTVPVYSEDYPYNNMTYWDGLESRNKTFGQGEESYSLSESIESNDKFQYLRTPEMIEGAIKKLLNHKNRLNVIADSLHQTAEFFYQKAAERKDSVQ